MTIEQMNAFQNWWNKSSIGCDRGPDCRDAFQSGWEAAHATLPEHARYKAALQRIKLESEDYESWCAGAWADAALNPTPPVPVTVAQLIAALQKFNNTRLNGADIRAHWIMFFKDESGGIQNHDGRVFSFSSLQEAFEFLNQ